MKDFKLPKVEDEKSILKTIRMKKSDYDKLEELSISTDLSINRIINECISFALDNLDTSEITKRS